MSLRRALVGCKYGMGLARLAASPSTLSARPLSLSSMSFTAEPKPGADAPTHTGQSWEDNDLRSVRFSVTGTEKQVNEQWAQELIQEVPVQMVATRIVACDGGGGALGHPKVYINLDDGEPKACIYCGLRYQLDPKAAAAAH